MYELSDEVYDDLVAKGEAGDLSDEQIAYLVAELERATDENCWDIGSFRVLDTFGLGIRNKPNLIEQYTPLVEKFLSYKKNAKTISKAYLVLTNFWELNEEYVETTKLFLRKVDWDVDASLGVAASKQAGEFLRKKFDKELWILLLALIEDASLWDYDDYVQRAVYLALARASGLKEEELPILSTYADVKRMLKEGTLSPNPIEYAKRQLLEHNCR